VRRAGWKKLMGAEQENGGGSHNTKKTLQGKWEDRWRAAARSTSEAMQPQDKRVLLLHEGLHKAESFIFTQIRTGKIGLADFLHRIGVPEAGMRLWLRKRNSAPHHCLLPKVSGTRNQLVLSTVGWTSSDFSQRKREFPSNDRRWYASEGITTGSARRRLKHVIRWT
jgi:hypothetical protein